MWGSTSAELANRASRIRAAMFSEWADEAAELASKRNKFLDELVDPAALLTSALLDLLAYKPVDPLAGQPTLEELIALLHSQDASVVRSAAQRIRLMTQQGDLAAVPAQMLDALLAVSSGENPDAAREAAGALAVLSEQQAARLHLFRSGGLLAIIRMLYSRTEPVVAYAVTTLHNLLLHVADCREPARQAGALDGLVPLLTRRNPKMLALVADDVYLLLLDSPPAKKMMLSLNGLAKLLDLLEQSEQHPKLLYTVVRCLRALSVSLDNEPNKARMVQLGAMARLFEALLWTEHDPRAQLAVLTTLRNLSDAATNEENSAPLIRRLLALLHNGSRDAVACACGILSNLTCNNVRNKQTVCSSEGVIALVSALNRFLDDEEITEPALCALRHCTARHLLAEQAGAALRQANALPLLLIFLSHSAPVAKAALGLLRNAALLPANLIQLSSLQTEHGETIAALAVDILLRAADAVRRDSEAAVDGIAMLGMVETALAALHQMAQHPPVAAGLLDVTELLPTLVELLASDEVRLSGDEVMERELLGLLYQLTKTPSASARLEQLDAIPLLHNAVRSSPHKSIATYASGVLRNVQSGGGATQAPAGAAPASAHANYVDAAEMEMAELGSAWQRDGREPELFPDYGTPMDPSQPSLPVPHNNSSWFDTDL